MAAEVGNEGNLIVSSNSELSIYVEAAEDELPQRRNNYGSVITEPETQGEPQEEGSKTKSA
ncbi:hypothetical protein OS493_013262 [Desmophyllum pertusum]|uniref:Uncharacterized protein n=1 Tax=Desmophyllum pertusum TaxID=174260 RepID=A0A9X0CMQ1_9CNID|nr:hypothetical protein OS493_013262 [Desmophyllum pertusum]